MNSNQTPNKTSSLIKTLIKLALVVGLFYFLASKGFISLEATQRAFTQWEFMGPALIAMVACSLLGVVRWQWLLRAHGIHLTWLRTAQLVFIGMFFNIALPGAVSGDFVKAFYVAKEAEGKRARAFGSILFDRVAGLSALVLVSAGALSIGIQSFWGTALLKGIQFFVALAAVSVVVFYAYLFLVREDRDPMLKIFRRLEGKMNALGAVTRIYEGLRHYHSHRPTVIRVLLVSIVIHVIIVYAFLNFAQALGEEQIPLLALYSVVPLGLLVTAIPIFPAGVGTGHAAFLALFHLFGSSRGADVFNLYAFTQILLSAVGGLVYLRFRGTEAFQPDMGRHGPGTLGQDEFSTQTVSKTRA